VKVRITRDHLSSTMLAGQTETRKLSYKRQLAGERGLHSGVVAKSDINSVLCRWRSAIGLTHSALLEERSLLQSRSWLA
jgi:hypothetical protein